jgi:teichuronic acid biosynthesis protein TuaE
MSQLTKILLSDDRKLTIKRASFTIFLLFSCLIGPNFSIPIFGIQISIYRFALVLAILFFFNSSIKQLFKFRNSNGFIYVIFLFLWFVYSLFTGLWVRDYFSWLKYLSFLGSGFIITLLIFSNINNSNLFISIIRVVVVLAGFLGILGIYESLTGNYFFLDESSLEWYRDSSLLQKVTNFREPITVFANPNNYALFLYYAVSYTFLLIFIEKKTYIKYIYIIILSICIFSIFITLSRSVFLGLIIFGATLLYLLIKKGPFNIKKRALQLSLIIFTILFFLLLKYAYFIDDLFVFDTLSDGGSDYLRQNLIYNGFIFLYESFFLGIGLGNIEFYMKFKNVYDVGSITNIHNWWMELLVSSGIIIFLYFLFLFLKTLSKSIKRINFNLSEDSFWINCVFASIQLGFIIASIGPSSLIGCEWFWPLLALSFKAPYLSYKIVNK